MKIPKIIRIGGVDYEIRDVDNLNDGECLLWTYFFRRFGYRIAFENQNHQNAV